MVASSVMPSLKQLFDTAPKRYAELKASAAANAVRAEWANFDRHSLEPYYFERHRFGRGKLVSEPIIDPKGLVQHSFDAEGRLRLLANYTELKPLKSPEPGGFIDRPCRRQYFEYFSDHADSILFDTNPERSVINVARYQFDGPRLVKLTHRYRNGKQSVAEFEWEASQLCRVHVQDANGKHTDEFTYDAAGQLTSIHWVDARGGRSETYRRVTQPLKALLKQIEELLIRAVVERLGSQELGSRAAAIGLWYNLENYEHLLPPGIAVLPEGERAELLAEHPARAADFVFSPVEWELFEDPSLELECEELQRACSDANQVFWQSSSHEEAQKLVDRVCKVLNKRVAELLPATDDCVVFPVDICSGDGAAGALRVASAKQRKLLQKRGLLTAETT